MKLNKIAMLTSVLVCAFSTAALAAESYYTDTKIKGYTKGDFVVLEGDDVNFRQSAEQGAVLKVLPRHSLLRAVKQQGDWLEAVSDGVDGYVYAPFTGRAEHEALTTEDFAVGYAALGESFNAVQAEAKLGKAEGLATDKKKKLTTYKYKNAALGVTKQQLTSIKMWDTKYITMRGVSVGDSAARAVGQYGLPDAVVYNGAVTTYEYFLPQDKKQQLRFALEINAASHVQAIILELVTLKK